MKIYKLNIQNVLIGAAYAPVIEPEDELYLPIMYCSECNMRPSNFCRSLPQASILDEKHPAILSVKAAMKRQQEVLLADSSRIFPGEEIFTGNDHKECITPEVLQSLIVPLVKSLNLPAKSQLFPTERIGISTLICRSKNIPDFSEATTPIVTQKVINVLAQNNITGWQLYEWPVKLSRHFKKKHEKVIPRLLELAIVGNAGEPLGVTENVHYKQCSRCGYRSPKQQNECLQINKDTWDGSDIFHFDWVSGVYVTERFREVVKKNKLTNVSFELISNI